MRHAAVIVLLAAAASPAYAYIGPGAGFAFVGSTFVFILTGAMLLLSALFWPIQWVIRRIRRRGISRRARTRRVVIVGLDGLEPKLAERFMAEGLLPNLSEVANSGGYSRLGTTLPALSPVAWSTFQTGVNPGAHNIFDFLTRDKRHCLPLLSSTATEGRRVRLLRRSQPFWKILGRHGIFSNVLRVPISYPPEKFYGNILSAMCTPDVRGSQGTFTFFSNGTGSGRASGDGTTGGERRGLSFESGSYRGRIAGPSLDGKPLEIDFSLTLLEGQSAELRIGKHRERLVENVFSPWLELEFGAGRRRVTGIARFCLRRTSPEVELYVSPINIHPERPVLPIGEPFFFPRWLAGKIGLFGTLGLLEDTWGRNEHALDDQRFLDQTYSIHSEREKMFLEVLDRSPEGLCVCVFDATDRIQHMFWRYLEQGHPSPIEDEVFRNVIRDMYVRMDELIGKVKARMRDGETLIVLSDHGFSSFRRGVNLNTWLRENGYLVLKENANGASDYLQDVDWSKTRAFGLGLSGIYLNREGREAFGIVPESEADALAGEIARKLEELRDPVDGSAAVSKVYESRNVYRGLYAAEAPDLIVGYSPGYRVSWDSVTGMLEEAVFSDNIKAWSGDHHVDPKLVPGVLFTNRKLKNERPHIGDIAPTVLDLFAVPVPAYMEGRVVF